MKLKNETIKEIQKVLTTSEIKKSMTGSWHLKSQTIIIN